MTGYFEGWRPWLKRLESRRILTNPLRTFAPAGPRGRRYDRYSFPNVEGKEAGFDDERMSSGGRVMPLSPAEKSIRYGCVELVAVALANKMATPKAAFHDQRTLQTTHSAWTISYHAATV
jgi:hypothetical protein